LILLIAFAIMIVPTTLADPDEIEAINTSGGWRLPFDGTMRITNGPLEGLHTVKSAEAIDYLLPSRASFEVRAPANGVVMDILDEDLTQGLGWLVRINHNGTTSFFAHLDPNNIFVTQGQNVKQGRLIAMTGNSGNGSGFHLHFESRTAVTQGTANSGNASPVRAIPGNWWNSWYSPPPDFQHIVANPSGGAQYPELATRPTSTSPGARHLSNQQSPLGVPAGWASNYSPTQISLHFGAAPNTPNTDWATIFYAYELRQNCNCWPQIINTTNPSAAAVIAPQNQSLPNGQHTFQAEDYNVKVGSSNNQRYWEALAENSANQIPHLVATFRPDTDSTTLEFCRSGSGRYKVFEYHGASSNTIYAGPACSVMVHRQLGGVNHYAVSARTNGVWSPVSQWLIVQY
jgi:murein DD-endopeptidase MepM/ murein hydrolase activator NlpD